MADAGYDVADYRDIAPVFGTLADAEGLIADAHAADLRVIVDLVPNHCSDQHEWFREALAAAPGSAQRRRFWFRDGRGAGGELPPTDLQSIFGGPAWTRVPDGQWYLHLFAPEQPDFNWDEPAVREEFRDVLRFWLDRGVDGIRVDSAALLAKDSALAVEADHTDLDAVHVVYGDGRRIGDA
jgi:alpha-glucosidase